MLKRLKTLKIVQSFLMLQGNTRISVMFEPMWGIPYILYNFYLSLYLKEMGINEKQFGILIAAGFISGAVFSMFGGIITDILGRKKTTFIFDFLSWPVAIFIYLISRSFWVYIIATVINNLVRIIAVSWNLMVVEDADSKQRISAYNLINIINVSLGIITPLAGILVASSGIVTAERIFMIFAIASMTTMMIFRNRCYTETRMGRQILEEHKGLKLRDIYKKGLFGGAFGILGKSRGAVLIAALFILFNLTLPLGAFNSMYFAPYMTGRAGIDKASVSLLGGIYSGVMLLVFLFVNPRMGKKGGILSVLTGLVLQGVSLALVTVIPRGGLIQAGLCVALYGLGFGISKPFIDSLLAEVSEGRDRAGFYSLVNTGLSIFSAGVGLASGYIYVLNPNLIFYITVGILAICAVTAAYYKIINNSSNVPEASAEGGKSS